MHAAADFCEERRKKRVKEMKNHLSAFRPQLNVIVRQKLFNHKDLVELPLMKELVEEDDCRIPLNNDRWQLVANILFKIVTDHGMAIELFFVKEMKAAREGAAVKHDPDTDGVREVDEDCIPSCLLAATSLFRRKRSYWLMSYTQILRERAVDYRISMLDRTSAWRNDEFDSSGDIVNIATMLLRQLELPTETTMSYMAVCGRVFRCLQCAHGPGSKKMRWSQLVGFSKSLTRRH